MLVPDNNNKRRVAYHSATNTQQNPKKKQNAKPHGLFVYYHNDATEAVGRGAP